MSAEHPAPSAARPDLADAVLGAARWLELGRLGVELFALASTVVLARPVRPGRGPTASGSLCCGSDHGTPLNLRTATCVVTGASSGIGRAIAIALASAGANVCAVARRRKELEATASSAKGSGRFSVHVADLVVDAQVAKLAEAFLGREGGLDVLVHSAGTISLGDLETAPIDDLDRQYASNVRAPYLLTRGLLPALRASRGHIVFVNSTVGLNARANVGQYAATKHALRAIADSFREEINPYGVRVTSVYPGRTATPRQAKVHAIEGKNYPPERLIQPDDIASVVLSALKLPRTSELTDVTVRPMLKH
jgi:NADP-dependent 3-hydroxy acid dehydrogenase YdfG